MSKISAEHLARGASMCDSPAPISCSTTTRAAGGSHALAERARALGWSEVVVIDDDLGVCRGYCSNAPCFSLSPRQIGPAAPYPCAPSGQPAAPPSSLRIPESAARSRQRDRA